MDTTVATAVNMVAYFVGHLLVTRRRWTGFLLWAASNAFLSVLCFLDGHRSTGCMFLIYLAANLGTLVVWARRPPESGAAAL